MDQPQRTVLVLSPWTSGFYYGTLLAGISEELATEGYRVVLAQTLEAGTPNGLEEHIPEYSGTYGWDIADGAIALSVAVTAEYVRRLRASGVPVSLASVNVPGSNAPAALPDNAGGITAALAHMIGHGHSKIAFLGNLVQYDTRERYEAWDTAMRDAGLTPRPEYFFNARDNEELGGEQGARAFLNLEDRPTAVVAGCDRNAIGFMRVVTRAGLRVPEDVAVIGYDNIAEGVMSSPPLTTVNQPFDEIGALAARLLLAQFHGENPSGIVHPRRALVVPRATCGCTSDQQSEPGPDPALLDGTSYRTLVRRALLRRQACGTEEISQALQSVGPILDQPEAMAALAETLHAHLDDAAAHAIDDTTVAAIEKMRSRTRVALWRQQTRHLVHQMGSTEDAIAEQHRVTTALLSGPAPERLSWLEGTRAKAGVLALRKGGALVVTGAVDASGTLEHLVGTQVTEAAFPPPELVACAKPDGSELTYVLPLVVHGKDWGVLAVVGPIDRVTDVQTWNQWGAQLCASLEQRHLAEALRANAQRYGAFAQALNEGMWEWNPSTGTATVSEKCRELLRVPSGAPDDEWHTMVMPEDRQAIAEAVRAAIAAPGSVVECEFRTVAGDQVRWLRGRAVAIRSVGGTLVVGSTADVTTRHLLEDELRRNALVDSVTGLPNRRDFIARLTTRIAQAATDPSPYAVVFLDIDRFKVVNDSLGHQVGDELLAVIAGRLLSALRANDIAARLGGDEYGVILDGLNLDMMPVVLERIRARLEEPVEIGGHLLWVTASLGVATSEGRYTDPSQVLQDADTAMYHAKSTNPGTVAYFDSTMRESVVAHQRLEASLRKALDNREFEVHYQPVVSLAGGAVRRFESLVRWRRPGVGLVPPSEFLPLMEETGLIVRLGQFVLDESCRQLAEWIPAHPDVQTSVNLSDKEFWHTDMVASVRAALARHGLTGASLTLELTESILDRKPVVARQILEDLRAMGIRLHVDDFGAGHSSLQTLHAFPVEALKIDRSFVSDLDQARPRELVRAIVAMGAILGVDVIAEGIETASQASTLRAMGCRSGQGYLYGAALPADVATALLNGPDSDAAVIEPSSPLPLVPDPRPAAERLSSRFVSLRHR